MKLLKNDFWIPDDDTHFKKWFEDQNWELYQIKSILRALCQLKGNTRTAIDIGAHVGFITKVLQWIFLSVKAFEPSPLNFECLKKNCAEKGTSLIPYAIGDKIAKGSLKVKKYNSGGNFVGEGKGKQIQIVNLDFFEFKDVDFIKLDIQGMEYEAIIGAETTIKEYQPILMIEDKDRNKIPPLLKSWGYKNYANHKKDMFWRPKYY